jgi:NAD(P)-dependent dehydrogenase (short-subunit alcohol dehydrogenase family)
MTGTAIVTGASSGLGLECARALAERDDGWHVVLAVRDPERGAASVAEIGRSERCSVIELELASLDSVRGFPERYEAAALPPLKAIVCNAGIQVITGQRLTADGFELTFGVNHLGHFALVGELLPLLAPPARIVVVSSGVHDPANATGMPAPVYASVEELAHPPDGSSGESVATVGRRRYSTSKLCNVLFTYELDRRLGEGAGGIMVNAFDPGLMPGSGLARDYSAWQRFAWRFVLPALRVLPWVRSARQSGRDLAALASYPQLAGVTGRYFFGRKEIRSSDESYDRVKAVALWEGSAQLVNGTDPSPD